MEKGRLILASGSPWRAECLRRAGIRFEKIVLPTDEAELQKKFKHKGVTLGQAQEYCETLARAKQEPYRRVRREKNIVSAGDMFENDCVVTADGVAYCDGVILEKALTPEKCIEQHRFISGKTNYALTAVCVSYMGKTVTDTMISPNTVATLPLGVIERISTEPETLQAAGYRLQGLIGEYCTIDPRDRDNINGLCAEHLKRVLEMVGYKI